MSNPTRRPAKKNRAGLRCWNCDRQHFRVVYTRPRLDGIYRQRKCVHCGTRFTTCERRLGA